MCNRWVLFLLCALCCSPVCRAQSPVQTARPFAVVELYTSEGCSSCPPAELIISKLIAASRQNKIRVFPISFHVDYWNGLGWRDPFSQNLFSQRQYAYGSFFKTNNVYTPQVIVNGTHVVEGYNRQKLQDVINHELGEPPFSQLHVKFVKAKPGTVSVLYRIDEYARGDVLHAVLVERSLQVDVARGENAGRTLRHDNVARDMASISVVGSQGKVDLDLSKVKDMSNGAVIIFVQNALTKLITAAEQLDLR